MGQTIWFWARRSIVIFGSQLNKGNVQKPIKRKRLLGKNAGHLFKKISLTAKEIQLLAICSIGFGKRIPLFPLFINWLKLLQLIITSSNWNQYFWLPLNKPGSAQLHFNLFAIMQLMPVTPDILMETWLKSNNKTLRTASLVLVAIYLKIKWQISRERSWATRSWKGPEIRLHRVSHYGRDKLQMRNGSARSTNKIKNTGIIMEFITADFMLGKLRWWCSSLNEKVRKRNLKLCPGMVSLVLWPFVWLSMLHIHRAKYQTFSSIETLPACKQSHNLTWPILN